MSANQKPIMDELSMNAYRDVLSSSKPVSQEKERELISLAQIGDESAMEELVTANLRFVFSIAKQYQGTGLSLIELIAEGNVGLINGIKRFDLSRQFKLISYAVWWIRQAILDALRKNVRVVNTPQNVDQIIRNLNKARIVLEQRLQRVPTVREIAGEMLISEEDVITAQLEEQNRQEARLDSEMYDEEGNTTFLEKTASGYPAVDYEFEIKELKLLIRSLVYLLDDEREMHIIIMNFGLDGEKPRNLEEIGRYFHISRERTRQLRERALIKLRRMIDSCNLIP
jgi:RNA polymerase primary sigma factor